MLHTEKTGDKKINLVRKDMINIITIINIFLDE
jgi:hypothetical protein